MSLLSQLIHFGLMHACLAQLLALGHFLANSIEKNETHIALIIIIIVESSERILFRIPSILGNGDISHPRLQPFLVMTRTCNGVRSACHPEILAACGSEGKRTESESAAVGELIVGVTDRNTSRIVWKPKAVYKATQTGTGGR